MAAAVRRGRWWRWGLVAAGVAVLVSLPGLVAALPARPAPLGVQQLVDRIATSASQPYQGFALGSGIAGLPSLPQVADVIALLNGETQVRAYYESPTRWRVDQLGVGTERDLYQTPAGQVLWDFGANQITDIVGDPPVRLPRGADLVPPDLARRFVAIARSAASPPELTALPARRVAGRSAAGLRLRPTEPAATLDHVDIWADPDTGLALQVEITGRGATAPVLVTRFLDVTFTAPDRSVLTPPSPGAGVGHTVTTAAEVFSAFASLRLGTLPDRLAGSARVVGGTAAQLGVGLYGTGFTQFLVLPVPRDTGQDALNRATRAGGIPVLVPGGQGVQLSTSLFSVLVLRAANARRSYLLVGLVDPALLVGAATELATFGPGR